MTFTRKLTLVLSSSLFLTGFLLGETVLAAPSTPPPKDILNAERDVVRTDRQVEDQMWMPTRVVRPHTWTMAASMISGLIRDTENESFFAGHLIFQKDMAFEKSQSYGLMIANSEIWGANWDMTHYFCMGCYSEVYWGYGIGSYWRTADQLASFVDIESYHLRGRLGFENLLDLNRRLRAELILNVGSLGMSGEVLVGWSFAP